MNNLDALRERLLQSGIASYKDTYKETGSRIVRRYDVYVGNTLIDGHLTMAQARRIRNEYRADGEAVKIIEYCEPIEKAEIHFEKSNNLPGLQNFETPAMTKIRCEQLLEKKRKVRPKATSINFGTQIVGPTGKDPKSPLHKSYLNAVKKFGFSIKSRLTNRIVFTGLESEIIEYLQGADLDNYEITYNGKKNK